ncbi:hypothetical protein BGX34_006231 [Mortierella sp. NVP85]|nr:hypothetical protein BGX34_006231 [Mortierella sp. NVP85]
MSEQHLQAFRARYSSEVITIPTRHDPKSGQRVVRWKDIQQYFENAKGVFNGKAAVLFLTDDELEDLTPLRIAHHPNVILEILVMDSSQGHSTHVPALVSGPASSSVSSVSGRMISSGDDNLERDSGTDMRSTRDVVSLRITEVGEEANQALVVHSSNLPADTQSSLSASGQLYDTYASPSHQFIDDQHPRLQLEMDGNMAQREQLRQLDQRTQQMRQQIEDILKQAQNVQQQMDDVSRKLQQSEQEMQERATGILQATQQSEQQIQGKIDSALQEAHQSERQMQGKLDNVLLATQQSEQQMQEKVDSILQATKSIEQQMQGKATKSIEQQMQGKVDSVLQATKSIEQQMQGKVDSALQATQLTEQQMQQKVDGALHATQLTEQQLQGKIDSIYNETQLTTQQMQERVDNVLQTIQQSKQWTQEQIDSILQKMQCSEQQTRQQFQQQIGDTLQKIQQLDQTPVQISKKHQETHSRQSLVMYRVQAILRTHLEDPLRSRLFIVLPGDSSLDEGRRNPDSRPFRVHLLCECGSHSMAKETKRIHEVHMTNHPGYDIKNPKEFFDKYGSYVLTMMYMAKYGVESSGFVVPPSAHIATKTKEGQENPDSIKENIDRLVDVTITYLEATTHSFDNDAGTTSQWNVGPTDLGELESHLEISEGEHFPSDPFQLTTQGGHRLWLCSEHYLEWAKRHVNDIVKAIGGAHTEEYGNINIRITSTKAFRQLYDAIVDIYKIQSIRNRLSLTLECTQLSLKLDIAHEFRNVSMTITRLSDLTSDDLELMRQYDIVHFAIEWTPEATDETRLIDILRKIPKLKKLCIGCRGDRSLDIVDFIISTRERSRQEGIPLTLQEFEVTEEGLEPFTPAQVFDGDDHITATVKFADDSATFDMDTRIVLQTDQPVDGDGEGWLSNFFRQYGWTISSLDTCWTFNDHLAELLDTSTRIHGSRLGRLKLSPFALTTHGLDAMDRVIKRSEALNFLWLYLVNLERLSRPEMAMLLLARLQEKVNSISFWGGSAEVWLPLVARTFPTRKSFPMLSELSVYSYSKCNFPQEYAGWLASMVSTLPHPLEQPPTDGSIAGASQQTMESSTPMIQLRRIEVSNFTFRPEDWETLIKAIDFSALEILHFSITNFSQEQLDLLIDRIAAADVTPVPLKDISLVATDLVDNADKQALRARILAVAPQIAKTCCVHIEDFMNQQLSQAFRARNSSEIITIPTRHDPKSGQRVVRWKDIQQYFENAKGILNGKDAVLFLTDDDLEDLIPLRIAHHPGVVLEVLVMDSGQGHSSTTQTHSSALVSEPTSSSVGSLSGRMISSGDDTDMRSMTRDVVSLRITEIGDNQALVVHSQGLPVDTQSHLRTSGQLQNTHSPPSQHLIEDQNSRLQLEMGNNIAQQEQLRQLDQRTQQMRQQIEEILQQAQNVQQQMDDVSRTLQQSEQQMQQRVDDILQTTQQTEQQMQVKIDSALQATRQSEQQMQQKVENVLQTTQLTEQQMQQRVDSVLQAIKQSEQQIQQRVDGVIQTTELTEKLLQGKIDNVLQTTQLTEQQIQQKIDSVLQATQQSEQQMQQKVDSVLQATQLTEQQLRQKVDSVLQATEQSEKQMKQRIDNIPQMTQHSEQHMQQKVGDVLQATQLTEKQTQQKVDNVLLATHQSEQEIRQQFQEQIAEILQQIQQLEARANESGRSNRLLMIRNREILQRLQETSNRQSLVQYRISTSIRDLSSSRLFIILPRNSGLNGEQRYFRVHLLCECGSHTMTKHAKKYHEVHMTDHPGYDLKNPKEFLDKYGPYVLTMMYMIRYGVTTSGFVVPPLPQSNFATIGRLVDSTITYLEAITRVLDIVPTSLRELRSYVNVNEREDFPSGLYHLTVPGQCSWVCNEHYLELLKGYLCDIVNTIGGTYSEEHGKIDIKITPDKVSKQMYDVIAKVCRTSVKSRLQLTMDCGRLSLAVGVSEGVQDVVVTVENLHDLVVNDITLIEQCNTTQLKVKDTPRKAEEARLVDILQRNPGLKKLQIGCRGNRSFAIIKLVISTKEKTHQSREQSELRSFEVTDEGLKPFDLFRDPGAQDHITATLTFSEGSAAFDMNTCINMQTTELTEFLRQYGWSITSLSTTMTFSDSLAATLDNATQTYGSRLAHLVLTPYSLTNVGLDAMERVIKRSQCLTYFWPRFTSLESRLEVGCLGLHRAYPNRSCLPMLSDLSVDSGDVPRECAPWLATMVSAPPLTPGSSSTTVARLKSFELSSVTLRPHDWEALVKAIDLSELLKLNLSNTNFTEQHLRHLTNRIERHDGALPLESLLLNPKITSEPLQDRLRQKAPQIEISS